MVLSILVTILEVVPVQGVQAEILVEVTIVAVEVTIVAVGMTEVDVEADVEADVEVEVTESVAAEPGGS